MKFQSKRAFLSALTIGVLGLASAANSQTAGTEELKIGVISALTGPGMNWGMSVLGGFQMAADEVNAKGGLKVGNKTYMIKVVAYDDKYSGQEAAQAAERLTSREGIKFIMGPFGSVPLLAVGDITERNKALVFSNSYTTKALSPKKPFTFRVTPTTVEFAAPMVAWITKNRPNIKSVAIITPNDESGTDVLAQSSPAFTKAGVKVASEVYERGVQDFVPILTKLLASKPDLIDTSGAPPTDSGIIMKQARQLGYTGQFAKVGGPGAIEIMRVAGVANAEGMMYYSSWDPEDKKIVDLMARFESKYKISYNPLGIFFYEGGNMLFNAMRTSGSIDSDVVRKQIESQKEYNGVLGKYVWGGAGAYGINHQWIAPFYIGELRQGKEKMLTKVEP